MKCLIIIAAFNEEKSILNVVNELTAQCPDLDFIVVDDGSTDRTRMICQQKNIPYLHISQNLGIGGAIQTGYLYARELGYDIAVQLDGDGQHNPEYIYNLIEPIEKENYDFCIGSRYIYNQGFQSSLIRRTGIVFLSFIIRLLTGERIADVTSGFRAVNRGLIECFSEDYSIDYPEPKAIVYASLNRFRIKEVPVQMRPRREGNSSITLWKSVYYMIKVTLDLLICRLSFGRKK